MLVPLYGFLRGDTAGLVVLVRAGDTLAEVARVVQEAACMRVAPTQHAAVWVGGKSLDLALTVAAAGLGPLDRVDVIPAPSVVEPSSAASRGGR